MKKAFAFIFLLVLAGAVASAQEAGSIRGKVVDNSGAPLPGATVTLTSAKMAPQTAITSPEGNFRFMRLAVSDDYTLKLELQGFKPYVRQQLVVSYGHDVELNIVMEQAALEEQITVVGQTPVIDTKKTQVGVNITEEMIMRLPTSRNPFVLMQLAPGMMIDREDVGGSDGGQQSSYYGHGSSAGDSTWNVDGANITDNSALGAAPSYMNMSGFEEIQINYGNNDIGSQTGGVQLNFITKRGGNNYTGTLFIDAEKNAWQGTNIPKALKDEGYTGAGINKVYLYGANFGGPIVKEKFWFYGSYGIQDLGTTTLAGTEDNTWLESGYFRLDGQLTKSTRFNAFYNYDNKQKWGRTNWGPTQQGPETLWNQVGPTPVYKGEIEQMFGNLFLNAKVAYTHNVFHLIPKLGERTADGSGPYEVQTFYPDFYASGNAADYNTVRPQTNANFNGNLFLENVMGADHEIKFGADYTQSTVSSYSLFEGNVRIAKYAPDWIEAWIIRDYYNNYKFNRASLFAQDTLRFGRLSVSLGLRYDSEKSIVANVTQKAAPFMANYLQTLSIDKFDPKMSSNILSPRFSMIYDISGDGKTVAKLNLARYGSQTGYEFAGFLNPVPWAEIDLRWVDANGDGRVTQNELWGTNWDTDEPNVDPNDPNGWSWYGGFDPSNPGLAQSTNKYDPKYKTPLLDEVSLSFEREIVTDFAARLEMFYKNRHRFSWDRGIMADGSFETAANYFLDGTDPVTGSPYYGRVEWPVGYYRTNTLPDGSQLKAYERYTAVELVLTKRLSHNWMMDGSFTLSDWKYFHGSPKTVWPLDLTNYDYNEGGVIAPVSGGSGISDVYVNSRWMGKLTGLYQFPLGIAVSGTFIAREGYVFPPYERVYVSGVGWTNLNATGIGKIGKFGDSRLPNFFELSLRAEKSFQITESLRTTVSMDVFNALNSSTALSFQSALSSEDFSKAIRIINPRVLRFGIRVDF